MFIMIREKMWAKGTIKASIYDMPKKKKLNVGKNRNGKNIFWIFNC